MRCTSALHTQLRPLLKPLPSGSIRSGHSAKQRLSTSCVKSSLLSSTCTAKTYCTGTLSRPTCCLQKVKLDHNHIGGSVFVTKCCIRLGATGRGTTSSFSGFPEPLLPRLSFRSVKRFLSALNIWCHCGHPRRDAATGRLRPCHHHPTW